MSVQSDVQQVKCAPDDKIKNKHAHTHPAVPNRRTRTCMHIQRAHRCIGLILTVDSNHLFPSGLTSWFIFNQGPQIIWPSPAGEDSIFSQSHEVEQGFHPGPINHFAKLLRAHLHSDLSLGLWANLILDVALGQTYEDLKALTRTEQLHLYSQ